MLLVQSFSMSLESPKISLLGSYSWREDVIAIGLLAVYIYLEP